MASMFSQLLEEFQVKFQAELTTAILAGFAKYPNALKSQQPKESSQSQPKDSSSLQPKDGSPPQPTDSLWLQPKDGSPPQPKDSLPPQLADSLPPQPMDISPPQTGLDRQNDVPCRWHKLNQRARIPPREKSDQQSVTLLVSENLLNESVLVDKEENAEVINTPRAMNSTSHPSSVTIQQWPPSNTHIEVENKAMVDLNISTASAVSMKVCDSKRSASNPCRKKNKGHVTVQSSEQSVSNFTHESRPSKLELVSHPTTLQLSSLTLPSCVANKVKSESDNVPKLQNSTELDFNKTGCSVQSSLSTDKNGEKKVKQRKCRRKSLDEQLNNSVQQTVKHVHQILNRVRSDSLPTNSRGCVEDMTKSETVLNKRTANQIPQNKSSLTGNFNINSNALTNYKAEDFNSINEAEQSPMENTIDQIIEANYSSSDESEKKYNMHQTLVDIPGTAQADEPAILEEKISLEEVEPNRPLYPTNAAKARLIHRVKCKVWTSHKGCHVPTYFVQGTNGTSYIVCLLNSMGWFRLTDCRRDDFRLKWVEGRRSIDFDRFRPGDQMVNHVIGIDNITSKSKLLQTLQEYDAVKRCQHMKVCNFLPLTFRLDKLGDWKLFQKHYKDGEVWICKPSAWNQGKGIYLIRSIKELEDRLMAERNNTSYGPKSTRLYARLIQRYICDPLLLNGHKFDLRSYMLIASSDPFVVLFHSGYVRRSANTFNLDCTDMVTHLTNQYVQKTRPDYHTIKEDTVWSMESLNAYLNHNLASNGQIPFDWVHSGLKVKMQKITLHTFQAVKSKLSVKAGCFQLLGFDFMIDEQFKVWLLEVNMNPALHTQCQVLKQIIPKVVTSSIEIVAELFDKKRRNIRLWPIDKIGSFVLLYAAKE